MNEYSPRFFIARIMCAFFELKKMKRKWYYHFFDYVFLTSRVTALRHQEGLNMSFPIHTRNISNIPIKNMIKMKHPLSFIELQGVYKLTTKP